MVGMGGGVFEEFEEFVVHIICDAMLVGLVFVCDNSLKE